MSVISSHWDRTSSHHGPSGSVGGGTPRKSGAFSQTAARRTMHSTYSASENFAGYGAHRTDDYPGPHGQQEMVEVVDPAAEFARPRTQFANERKSRGVSFASEFDGATNTKLNSVYSQGHQRSKSSLSGAMGAALRQRPSLYTNASSTTVNVLPSSSFAQQPKNGEQRKESVEMVLSPDQSSGPWVLGEDDVDGFRLVSEQQENLVEVDAAGEKAGQRASRYSGVQSASTCNSNAKRARLADIVLSRLPKGLGVLTDATNRASLVSRASSYGSQTSGSGQAVPSLAITTSGLDNSMPMSPDLSTPLTPLTKAATVASYFPPPPANVTSPDDAFQAYARERSGSIAAAVGGQQQQVDVRRSTVGDNNPFRSSMVRAACRDLSHLISAAADASCHRRRFSLTFRTTPNKACARFPSVHWTTSPSRVSVLPVLDDTLSFSRTRPPVSFLTPLIRASMALFSCRGLIPLWTLPCLPSQFASSPLDYFATPCIWSERPRPLALRFVTFARSHWTHMRSTFPHSCARS